MAPVAADGVVQSQALLASPFVAAFADGTSVRTGQYVDGHVSP